MKDDLLQGSITRHILRMGLPTMAGLSLQGLYDLIDMMWIGQISYAAVAAVTIYVSVFWIFEVVNEIIGMSSVSLISQSYGARDTQRATIAAEQTLSFKFLVSCIAALLLFVLLRPLISLFTDSQQVSHLAYSYGSIRTISMPLFFSSFSVNTIFRCTGDAKTPMILLAISAVVNTILDPLLMFDTVPLIGIRGAGLGVAGAAYATVISFTLAFCLGLVLLLRSKASIPITIRGLFRIDRKIAVKLMTIGLPSGFEMLFRNVANSLVVKMVATYGTAALALIGVGTRVYSLLFMPLLGIVLGSGTIAGQNLGAGRVDRAQSTARSSAIIAMVITTLLTCLVLLFSEDLLHLFLSDVRAVEEGIIMLRIVIPSLILAAAALGYASVFSGAGYTMPFLISCVIAKWGFMLPYIYIVIYVLELGLSFVWYSFIISELVELLVILAAFRRGRWKGRRV